VSGGSEPAASLLSRLLLAGDIRVLRVPVTPPEAPSYVRRATSGGTCHVRAYDTTEVCQHGGPAHSVLLLLLLQLPPPHPFNLHPFNHTNQFRLPPPALQPSPHLTPPLQFVHLFRQLRPLHPPPPPPPLYGSSRSTLQA